MDTSGYVDLLASQSGVVSRRQLGEVGVAPHDLQRMLRRRDLTRVHDGVFVDHTGHLTWLQRAWVGVQVAWPAALSHDSALRAADGPGRQGRDETVIHVAVDRNRAVRVPSGYLLHRVAGFEAKVQWNSSPPRIRVEEALLDVAAHARDDLAAVAVLADAVQARRTVPARVRKALDRRARIPRRDFLHGVLTDVQNGTCSVLEHGYLTLVEQAHGLPAGRRQVRDSERGPVMRDVVYVPYDQVVELDGRQYHDSAAQRDADLDRDLDAATSGLSTVRLGWGQVYGRPCDTAVRVGRLLNLRGWAGEVTLCPRCPDRWRLTG